jgi:hypothetical protein
MNSGVGNKSDDNDIICDIVCENKRVPDIADCTLFIRIISNDLLYQQVQDFGPEIGMNNLWSRNFQDIKMAKFHWNLNKSYSAKYLSENIRFVSKFHLLVSNTRTQLSLKLPAFKKATDISSLSNVYAVDFSESKTIYGISLLRNVHELNLSGCDHIGPNDVSVLGYLHSLDLSWCCRMRDISALRNVHKLNLKGCLEINDYSALGSVNTLTVSCSNMIDVSAFCNVHTLDLSSSDKLVNVGALSTVHSLNLSCCKNIVDVSALSNVKSLNLNFCKNIVDVSALGNVKSLNLSKCLKIVDVNALGGVHELSLRGCRNLIDVSALGHVYSLDLRHCSRITDVSALR